MTTLLFTSPLSLEHPVPPGHPERPDRMRAVTDALADEAFEPLVRRDAELADPSLVLLAQREFGNQGGFDYLADWMWWLALGLIGLGTCPSKCGFLCLLASDFQARLQISWRLPSFLSPWLFPLGF